LTVSAFASGMLVMSLSTCYAKEKRLSLDPHGETNQPLPKEVDGPSMHDKLVEDILARKEFGLRKYGQPLRANNGRDTLRDAYEEVLDLAVYLRTLIAERDSLLDNINTKVAELGEHK
jgi:hypothetical protein